MKTKNSIKARWSLLPVMIILFSFLLSNCRKDTLDITPGTNTNTNITTPATNYNSINDFYSQNGAPSQFFTLDPTITNSIAGEKGVTVNILANTFVHQNGLPPSGNIVIELREILTYNDMILSNKPTTSDGNILVSGGEIFLQATSNGSPLRIDTYKYLQINVPATNPDGNMEIFYGVDSSNIINWVPMPPDTLGYGIFTDSSGYVMYIDSLGAGWINCDYFYNDPNPTTNILVNPILDNTVSENVFLELFIVFKSINSVMGVFYISSSNQFSSFLIPINMDATLVGIGLGDDSKILYYGSQDITVSNGLEVDLTYSEISESDLIAAIKNL